MLPAKKMTLLASLLMFSTFAVAEDAPKYDTDTLTGDWGGNRTLWYQQGLAFDIGYKSDILQVIDSGQSKSGRPIHHLDVKLKADLEKLWGLESTTALLNVIYDRGDQLNSTNVGSLLGVSNIEVTTKTYRILNAWMQKEWLDGHWSLLGGIYPIDSEFMALESAGIFMQPPYGVVGDLSLTNSPSIFNTSTLGIRAKWLSPDRNFYGQWAVTNGISGDPEHLRGTHVRFGYGAMSIAEIGYRPTESAPPSAAGAADHAEVKTSDPAENFEKYSLGLWGYSADDRLVNPVNDKRRSGWYAQAEKTIAQGTKLGDLSVFLRHSRAYGNASVLDSATNAGLRLRGLLPGRDADVAGIAYTRARLNDEFRVGQINSGTDTAETEQAWEITYHIQIAPWLAIQPDWQKIVKPTGSSPNATIAGVRVELTF
ncbi:Porin [Gammaproteobacteria bacterium]